jgi:hypothetical protein
MLKRKNKKSNKKSNKKRKQKSISKKRKQKKLDKGFETLLGIPILEINFDGIWLKGKILEKNDDNTYKVFYEDEDMMEDNVTKDRIRIGSTIPENLYVVVNKNGNWVDGKILKRNSDDTYQIFYYDDGLIENVKESNITLLPKNEDLLYRKLLENIFEKDVKNRSIIAGLLRKNDKYMKNLTSVKLNSVDILKPKVLEEDKEFGLSLYPFFNNKRKNFS